MSRGLRGNLCYLTAGDAPGDGGFRLTSHLTAQIHPTPDFLCQLNIPLRILYLRRAWKNKSSNNFRNIMMLKLCGEILLELFLTLYDDMDWTAGQQAWKSRNSHLTVILSSCVKRGVLQLHYVSSFDLNPILHTNKRVQTNVVKNGRVKRSSKQNVGDQMNVSRLPKDAWITLQRYLKPHSSRL